MSSRAFRTSPEVADLIRQVEATQGWSAKQGPKVVQFLHPDGEQVIRLGNTADAGDVKQAISVLTKFGVLSSFDTAGKAVTETVTVRRDEQEWIDPYPNWSVFEKSKKVWKAARDYAVATSKPLLDIGGAEYYLIDDRVLATFIARVLPKIKDRYFGVGGTREVYDYLRSTGNAVREHQDDESSLWVVRTVWSDEGAEVIIRNPRKAVSDYEIERQRKERKLREEEVSQRLRAPQDDLVITHTDPKPPICEEPVVDMLDLTEEEQQILDEALRRRALLTCPECKEVGNEFVAANPQGLALHRKAAHGIEAKGTSHLTVVSKIKPGDPKAEVGIAFQMLAEAMDAFMVKAEPNEALISEVAALGTQVAEMQQEMAFLRADNEVQRLRAQRAEEVIGCIRLAFDTQPMHQAAASTIDLLPPVKD